MKKLCGLLYWILTASAFVTAHNASAQAAKCPWLNAATAAGVLGGDVELLVSAQSEAPPMKSDYPASDRRADQADVACTFRRKAGDHIYQLQIAVTTLADPELEYPKYRARCKSQAALTAIGNEAVQCRMEGDADGAKSTLEEVIARVRNRAFVLIIDRAPEMRAQSKKGELSDDARNVAEQVAGSLF